MGTSLSGLTPATTFDGLLKTSDNDAITSSLKTIGSGDGTDSCLQLSDSALKVNSGAVTIVGTGATSATTSLLVQNSGGDDMFKTTDDGGTTLKSFGASNTLIIDTSGGVSGFQMNSSNGQQRFRIQGTSTATRFTPNNTNDAFTFVGNGIYTSGAFDIPSARLHVKGAGATSATTSLLVQNSDGTEHLKITDDGVVNARQSVIVNHATNSSRSLRLGWGSLFATDNASELLIGAVFSQNTAPRITLGGKTRASGADAVIVQALNGMYLSTTAYTEDPSAQLHVKGSGNSSADYALRIENSLASTLIDARNDGVIRLAPNSNQTALFNNAKIRNGDASFGTSTIPASTRVTIKGQGATSATTALLVQNSAGTDIFKVADSGAVTIESNIYTAGDYRNIGRNSLNSIRFASGETRVAVQGTSSGNRFHVYASSTAASVFSVYTQTQQVGVGNGNTALETTAKLQVDSTTQGFLPPRMTGEQIDAIESPASGLIIYNTTSNKAVCYNGTSWNDMF